MSADALDLDRYPYRSLRMPILATRGVVATSQPLAAQAGLAVLQGGGNAVDAAVAAAITLTVVEPTCNGVGGDAFALIWDGRELHGLDGAGRALSAHTRALFQDRGLDHVPDYGWLPVTVPGGPAAWRDMHRRFGHLPFAELFASAIAYAEGGFPVAPLTAHRWRDAAARYHAGALRAAPEVAAWGATFLRDGAAPRAGDRFAVPDLARTLRELAETECESFYRGEIARRIVDFAEATRGLITHEDLASHESSWVKPICTTYRGHEIWEMPPSTQGIAALEALAILDGFDLTRIPRESAESYHLQIEAIKIALHGAFGCVGDPDHARASWQLRLSPDHVAEQRRRIGPTACTPSPSPARAGDTVYLAVADEDGMMVSFIQSNYSGWLLGFGSGVVVPNTGIALHSRACAFTLAQDHPNSLAPRKRPFHTLAPAFLTREGRASGPFGIMGGPMQPQGHVQFIVNQLDYGMNPQAALDAPRFQWLQGTDVEVELGVPPEVMQGLVVRGHGVRPCVELAAIPPRLVGGALGSGGLAGSGDFGKAQIIRRLDNGTYVAGSDWRSDGCAVGY